MTDLIAFLDARLDEDEAAARAALPIYGPDWHPENSKVAGLGPARIWGKDSKRPVAEAARRVSAAHIARHDPARALREVEAKRAILKLHAADPGHPDFCEHDMHELPCPTLRLLAVVWSDHPDYRREWAA